MVIDFSCQNCGHAFHVPERLRGARAKCNACGNIVVVPAVSAPSGRPHTPPPAAIADAPPPLPSLDEIAMAMGVVAPPPAPSLPTKAAKPRGIPRHSPKPADGNGLAIALALGGLVALVAILVLVLAIASRWASQFPVAQKASPVSLLPKSPLLEKLTHKKESGAEQSHTAGGGYGRQVRVDDRSRATGSAAQADELPPGFSVRYPWHRVECDEGGFTVIMPGKPVSRRTSYGRELFVGSLSTVQCIVAYGTVDEAEIDRAGGRSPYLTQLSRNIAGVGMLRMRPQATVEGRLEVEYTFSPENVGMGWPGQMGIGRTVLVGIGPARFYALLFINDLYESKAATPFIDSLELRKPAVLGRIWPIRSRRLARAWEPSLDQAELQAITAHSVEVSLLFTNALVALRSMRDGPSLRTYIGKYRQAIADLEQKRSFGGLLHGDDRDESTRWMLETDTHWPQQYSLFRAEIERILRTPALAKAFTQSANMMTFEAGKGASLDMERRELEAEFGAARVAKVTVVGARTSEVEEWFKGLAGSVARKCYTSSSMRCQILLAPVDDIEALARKIDFGTVVKVDRATGVIEVHGADGGPPSASAGKSS